MNHRQTADVASPCLHTHCRLPSQAWQGQPLQQLVNAGVGAAAPCKPGFLRLATSNHPSEAVVREGGEPPNIRIPQAPPACSPQNCEPYGAEETFHSGVQGHTVIAELLLSTVPMCYAMSNAVIYAYVAVAISRQPYTKHIKKRNLRNNELTTSNALLTIGNKTVRHEFSF